MTTYYWVGGSGTWDAATTTNWALSSGGSGGAGVPTSADDVIFDASSNAVGYTVTIGTNANCKDFTAAGPASGTVAFTVSNATILNCYGSFTLPASGATWTGAGLSNRVNFLSSATGNLIVSNGVTINNTTFRFDNSNGEWLLGGALALNINAINSFTITNGTFRTDNYSLTIAGGEFRATGGNIYLGSSTITASNSTSMWTMTSGVLVFDAGTSTITSPQTNSTFNGGGFTYYNLTFTSGAPTRSTVNGSNTFNNLTQNSLGATGIRAFEFGGDQIINGTLTIGAANTNIRRLFVRSTIVGVQRTITLNGTLAALSNVDFRDINAAGTVATPWTGTRLGDCKGNSNITFDASKTVYRVGTGNWSATKWSLSSGGAVNVNNFPLAQDTMIFDTGTTTGTHTIDSFWQLGSLDCSSLAVAVTIASGTTVPSFYGNITLDADVTLTGTGVWTFAGQGTTQTITSAGITFTQPLTIDSPSGIVVLADNLIDTNTTTLFQGTLDVNDQTLTANVFSSSNSNTRSIDFGTGKIILKGTGTVWTTATNTGFTTAGTPVVDVDNNTATATTVTTGALSETNSISFNYISGTYTLTSTANNAYKNLNFTGFSGTISNLANTIYGNLVIDDAATYSAGNNGWTFAATSGIQQITTDGETLDMPFIFNAPSAVVEFQDSLTQGFTRAFTITNGTVKLKNGVTSTVGAFATSGTNQKFLESTLAGSQATLSQASGTVNVSNLTIQDINATGGATWNAFVNQQNIDAGNNDGWDFFVQLGQYMYTRRKNKRLLIS